MRQKIVAGNWKMNTSYDEAIQLAKDVASQVKESANAKVIVCPPFPYLQKINEILTNSPIDVGAQNCSEHVSGAYTGEVSAVMLKSMGIPYVILGHSERRQYFNESGNTLAQKVDGALANGLTPIYCCGEPLEVREMGGHEGLVKQQIEEGLFHLNGEALKKIVIAYEPVWAIGTGKTATTEQAQEMHKVIRDHLANKYQSEVAELIPILYGGSVKPDNAKELFACPDVDGGLVGGASLKAADFVAIIEAV
ncbi:MAG: triose-phosphate isomerase [Cyclobacteriaceae bacterium]